MFKTLVSTALIAAAAFAVPAAAGTPVSGPLRVSVADLDLATPRGQTELDRRLTVAINQVCGSDDQRDLTAQAEIRRCRDVARTSAAPRRAAMIAAATPIGDHKALASR